MASDRAARRSGAVLAAVLCAVLCAGPASGQSALVANLLYEGPALVAPALVLISAGDDGRAWSVGITGWTLAGEWSRRGSPARTLVTSASVTPLNANGSDRMFRDGARVPELAYRNASAEVGLGLRLHPSAVWRSEVRVVGRYERVSGLPDATRERWRRPFAGLEATQVYQRISAEDPLRSTMEGFRVQGRLEAFAGAAEWGRLVVAADGGHALGPLLLRGHASYMFGHELDTVSAFLVGGSWDAPGVRTLYGHPYAAFRVDRGTLVRGGAELPLGGEWRVGVRAAHLSSPGAAHSGGMVRVGTAVSGVRAYVGVAVPDVAIRDGAFERTLLIAGVSAALLP